MTKTFAISALALLFTVPALAQGLVRGPGTTGAIVLPQPNTTGNDPSLIIARGSTGAETVTTNSAAGGNAGQPERAIPQGSANGGGSSR
ncbi:hypothetical protein BHAOGJBA_4852 [Methylobacterium hispanicum]|jgi:hypothetical protein|uniref:Uncharacterized protein n=1 Tax=Methylobacterium hispanicum TaxID=270350 RepID=A0AAV4ZTS2_9HYPH|nr:MULTISPECIES: hypothetical protein [Methylobacterium]GJD91304.1 hypothetical protein BHAOGJBA_4852 [Methylobacterium hispanicum]